MIFIGDVHGVFNELSELLEIIEYQPLRDHLIFVGDLVAKGPESIKVVSLARSLEASCVRGNHDDKMLRWKTFLNSLESQGIDIYPFKTCVPLFMILTLPFLFFFFLLLLLLLLFSVISRIMVNLQRAKRKVILGLNIGMKHKRDHLHPKR